MLPDLQQEVLKEVLDLKPAVARAVRTVRPLVAARRQYLSVSVPLENVRVEAAPALLERLLVTLVLHAAECAAPGGQIRFTVGSERAGVAFRVRDGESGASQARWEGRAPAPVAPGWKDDGWGMAGLLARELAQQHDAQLESEADGLLLRLPSVGARRGQPGGKRVSGLPVSGLPVSGLPVSGSPVQPASSDAESVSSPATRVLVVDDNREATETLAELLSLWGYVVRVAHDGPAALAAAGGFRPEVVLLDLGLPGMDGCDLARRLRQEPGGAGMSLVALTGHGGEEDRRRTRDAGFSLHLTKPVDPAELRRRLATLP